jgi:type 1 glutamine amidotransferase/HEAT repeat protein
MKASFQVCLLIALALSAAPAHAAEAAAALAPDQAFEQLATYDQGQSTVPLLTIERFVGRISKYPAQRQQTAERLATILARPQTSDVARVFICQQLRLVGGEAQVPLLAKLLEDAKTSHPARIALQDMPGAAAAQALLAALSRVQGDSLIGLIQSLALRHETAAVPPLARLLGDPDATVSSAAALALGRIGTTAAANALAATPPTPAVTDAQLACAAELVRQGDFSTAEPIYRRLFSAGQPLNLRLAALSGLASAAPGAAAPLVVESLTASQPALQNLALELARKLPDAEAAAALNNVLPKLEGQPRLLALGALAERGDTAALAALNSLAADKDATLRGEASRELRRLRYAAKDAQVRAQIETVVQESDSSAATLAPPPYEPSVIDQRKKQLAASLVAGDKLLCYLDCGVEGRTEDSGVSLRQLGGQGWLFPNSASVAGATFGTIAYDGNQVEFELAGLDPQKHYALGFSWWDFDNNGRSQSIQFAGGQPARRVEALPGTKLPAYVGAQQGPATGQLPIDPALIGKGRLRVAVQRRAAANATVSELWLLEAPAGSASATKATLGGVPVPPAAPPVAKPKAPVNLDPPADGTRILIVTGDDYPGHPWQETAPALKAILEQDARLRVRVVEDPEALASPKLKLWDAVIVHFMDWEKPGPGPAARANLQQFVAGGKGLMLTHFACGAWDGNEWPEFGNLAGRVWDPKLRGHDPHGKFRVLIADPDHPITKGLEPFETVDELYTCLAGAAPIHVVAQATSKVDKKDYPLAFVLNYGQGRVFHTVLGHNALAYTNNPGVGELMRRGCAWAAGLPPTK